MPFPANKQTFFVLSSSSSSTKWNGRIQCRLPCSPDIFTIQIIGTRCLFRLLLANTLNQKSIFGPKIICSTPKFTFPKDYLGLKKVPILKLAIRNFKTKNAPFVTMRIPPKRPKSSTYEHQQKSDPFPRMLSYKQPLLDGGRKNHGLVP